MFGSASRLCGHSPGTAYRRIRLQFPVTGRSIWTDWARRGLSQRPRGLLALTHRYGQGKLPATAVGTLVFVVVPLPRSPELLSPQQYAAPFDMTPQLWAAPGVNAFSAQAYTPHRVTAAPTARPNPENRARAAGWTPHGVKVS